MPPAGDLHVENSAKALRNVLTSFQDEAVEKLVQDQKDSGLTPGPNGVTPIIAFKDRDV